eukprot:UN3959
MSKVLAMLCIHPSSVVSCDLHISFMSACRSQSRASALTNPRERQAAATRSYCLRLHSTGRGQLKKLRCGDVTARRTRLTALSPASANTRKPSHEATDTATGCCLKCNVWRQ